MVAHGEAERRAAELVRSSNIDGFGGGIGVNALGVGRGRPHPVALCALGGGRGVAAEIGHPGDDEADLTAGPAVGFIHAVADPAMERREEGGNGPAARGRELFGEGAAALRRVGLRTLYPAASFVLPSFSPACPWLVLRRSERVGRRWLHPSIIPAGVPN